MTSKEALENWYNTESPNTKAYEYEHHYRLIKKDLEMLEILKTLIEIIPNNTNDTNRFLNIRIKPLHIISDKTLLEIKEWLDEK